LQALERCKNARHNSRNWKFESISLQRRVSCEPRQFAEPFEARLLVAIVPHWRSEQVSYGGDAPGRNS
jgi:hypothetical protein